MESESEDGGRECAPLGGAGVSVVVDSVVVVGPKCGSGSAVPVSY